ncbi:hypothetical protein GCM10029992_28030 [Glycomyces albus]
MTSTPSVRSGPPERQAPIAPDRMNLVEDWKTDSGDYVELYADSIAADGYVIVFGPYGAEHAADLQAVTWEPEVTWRGTWAQRPEDWRIGQEHRVRTELSAWARS